MFLLETRLRKKLLTYSFKHSDEQYYLSELSSLIGEDPGNLSRELRKLEQEGLFRSFPKGKLKFYTLNKQYPLYKQLREIVLSGEGTL